MYRPNGRILHKKICKHGSHFDPHASKQKKNLKHAGQICKESVKKIIANILKMSIYSLSKSYQNRSKNMGPPPFFSENGLRFCQWRSRPQCSGQAIRSPKTSLKLVKGSRSIIIMLVLVRVGYYYYIGYFRLQLCHLTILCIYIHKFIGLGDGGGWGLSPLNVLSGRGLAYP